MSRFLIELAKPSDDAELRKLDAEQVVNGSVQVYFRHEPSFFQSVRVQGVINQIGVVRDSQTEKIVGMGIRSVRPAYINGTAANLGYLGGLWLDPSVRSGTLLARIYRSFYELHRDRQTQLYITTIPEDADEIRQLLTSGRAGLPYYDDFGRYYAVAIRLRSKGPRPQGPIEVIRANSTHLQELEECLNQYGPRRQFFPCFIANDFLSGLPHLRDLRTKDFYLAMEQGRAVGVAALWNQMAFRQFVLAGYRGWRRMTDAVLQRMRKFLRQPARFQVGQEIPYIFLSFLAVQDDRRDVFRVLLRTLCHEAAEAGACCLLAGFHEKDPLLREVGWCRPYVHTRRLYVVYWEDGLEFRRSLQNRTPYVELATL